MGFAERRASDFEGNAGRAQKFKRAPEAGAVGGAESSGNHFASGEAIRDPLRFGAGHAQVGKGPQAAASPTVVTYLEQWATAACGGVNWDTN